MIINITNCNYQYYYLLFVLEEAVLMSPILLRLLTLLFMSIINRIIFSSLIIYNDHIMSIINSAIY